MEKDYIDRLGLLREIYRQANRSSLGEIGPAYLNWKDVVMCIQDAAAEDVAPVVHGKWIKTPCSEKNGDAHCSVCHHFDWSDCNYCSNCGAKMVLGR